MRERENENIIKLGQQKYQLELDTISEENRKRLFDAKVKEIWAIESSDESLDGDLGEQTILNNDNISERVTEWVDSSVANNILSTTLRSNRAENEMQENGFFQASNSLPPQETDNLLTGPSMLQNSVNAPNAAPGPLLQQSNHSSQKDGNPRENFVRTPKRVSYFLSFRKKDRQTSPQASNNVANKTADAGASAPQPSQLPEPSSWAPAPIADPYLNQPDHHLANINNPTLTNLPSRGMDLIRQP